MAHKHGIGRGRVDTPKESFLSPTANFLLSNNVDVALDLSWEGELLEMESDDKLQPVSQ